MCGGSQECNLTNFNTLNPPVNQIITKITNYLLKDMNTYQEKYYLCRLLYCSIVSAYNG